MCAEYDDILTAWRNWRHAKRNLGDVQDENAWRDSAAFNELAMWKEACRVLDEAIKL